MKLNIVLLVLTICLGFLVRVFFLSDRPLGLTWDEAALGYNAYSLLHTGRDEHGQPTPIIFKSFGDYKPGLYIYFAVLPTAILGLNELSTRIPSVIFGTLVILLVYVLARQLFPSQKRLAQITLFVSVFNPWLVHFSRGAWEANLNLFLITLGVSLFLFGLRKKSSTWHLAAAGIFGLSFWAYQSAKLFTPLLLISLGIIFRKSLQFKKLLPALFVIFMFLTPVLLGLNTQSGRLKVFSVFSYSRGQDYVSRLLYQDKTTSKNWIYYLFHSELLDQMRGVYQRYLNHFSPRYLFIEGDWTNLRHSEYKLGLFYLIDFIPLLFGLIFLIRYNNRSAWLLVIWVLLAPLPAALSRDLVSGVRSLPLSVPLTIIISIGINSFFHRKYIRHLYILPLLFMIVYYFEFYFFHAHYYGASYWVSAYKSALEQISANLNNYSNVIFTEELGQPYIFVLYHLRYDPALFQKQVVYESAASGDVGRVTSFGKYSFRPIFWPELRGKSNAIFIGGQYELPEKDLNINGLTRISDINWPNGVLALRIVGIK